MRENKKERKSFWWFLTKEFPPFLKETFLPPFKERSFLELLLGAFLLPFSLFLTQVHIGFALGIPLSVLILLHSIYLSVEGTL